MAEHQPSSCSTTRARRAPATHSCSRTRRGCSSPGGRKRCCRARGGRRCAARRPAARWPATSPTRPGWRSSPGSRRLPPRAAARAGRCCGSGCSTASTHPRRRACRNGWRSAAAARARRSARSSRKLSTGGYLEAVRHAAGGDPRGRHLPGQPDRCRSPARAAAIRLALYAAIRPAANAGYGGLIFDGSHWLLSFGPELFFALKGRAAKAKPMKGTRPRGRTRGRRTARWPAELAASVKDKAENLMIVDLLRNDLQPRGRGRDGAGRAAVRDRELSDRAHDGLDRARRLCAGARARST